jgi:hypothetical protein
LAATFDEFSAAGPSKLRGEKREETTMEATNASPRALSALVGEWTTEATHPVFLDPGPWTKHGRAARG